MISTSTVYDLIHLGLRELGIVALGDTVDDAVAQEALLTLNAIRADLSIKTKSYKIYDETWIVTENRQYITLGSTATVTGDMPTRPHDITQVVIIQGQPGTGVNIPMTLGTYEEYREQPLTNVYAVPNKAYPDTMFPIQRVWFYPGLTPGWSVRVQGHSYLTEYENVGDTYFDPPDYFTPLSKILALHLAPKWGIEPGQGTVIQANSAMKHIKQELFIRNLKSMPNGLQQSGSGFNVFAGR